MESLPDIVEDARLRTEYVRSVTRHTFVQASQNVRQVIRTEDWERERRLGRGGQGQVWLERCVGGEKQGSLRAIKRITKGFQARTTESIQRRSTTFIRELETIAKFSHPRYSTWFVRSDGWFEDMDYISIAMEYCPHGDLQHHLSGLGGAPLPTEQARDVVHQILEGLDHMHRSNFAHRDLKPANILIKSMSPTEAWWVVLADFGISKRAEPDGPPTVLQGTPGFMAPELLRSPRSGDEPRQITDFQAADMWALGEVAFTVLSGKATFSAFELADYCRGALAFPIGKLPAGIGEEGCDFVASLMRLDSQSRPSTSACLSHSWMSFGQASDQQLIESLAPIGQDTSATSIPSGRWTTEPVAERPGLVLPIRASVSSTMIPTASEPGSQETSTQTVPSPVTASTNVTQGIQLEFVAGPPPVAPLDHDWRSAQPLKLLGGSDRVQYPVRRVRFCPTGRTLAATYRKIRDRRRAYADDSARRVGIIDLWDVQSGSALVRIRGLAVHHIAFSPDGDVLASAHSDGTVKLWDVRSNQQGQPRKILRGESDAPVSRVTFSPDGRTLASMTSRGCIRLWHYPSCELMQVMRHELDRELKYQAKGDRLYFSRDSMTLWSSRFEDGRVLLWNGESDVPLRTIRGEANFVLRGTKLGQIACLVSSHTAQFFDMRGNHVGGFQTTGSIRTWYPSNDGTAFAAVSEDRLLVRNALAENFKVDIKHGFRQRPQCNRFSADGRFLAVAGREYIRVFSAESGQRIKTMGPYRDMVFDHMEFSPAGTMIATGSPDGRVRLWG